MRELPGLASTSRRARREPIQASASRPRSRQSTRQRELLWHSPWLQGSARASRGSAHAARRPPCSRARRGARSVACRRRCPAGWSAAQCVGGQFQHREGGQHQRHHTAQGAPGEMAGEPSQVSLPVDDLVEAGLEKVMARKSAHRKVHSHHAWCILLVTRGVAPSNLGCGPLVRLSGTLSETQTVRFRAHKSSYPRTILQETSGLFTKSPGSVGAAVLQG